MTKRILCVDDEPELLDSIQEFLQTQGYDVTVAMSGREALEIAEREPLFDLILCDIAMPEMDGLALLRLLRANRRYVAVPFIFMTALSHKDDMIKAHRLGCDEYLVKPIDLDLLSSLVTSRLERGAVVEGYYSEPQQAFQQLMIRALTDEMMEPTNAIVSTSSFISQMLEGGDELLERRFNQVYQSAAQQLNMLQQLSQMLEHQSDSHVNLADYPCPAQEICTHIERLLRVYNLQESMTVQGQEGIGLHCDPFLISKAFSSLMIRESRRSSNQKMTLRLYHDDSTGCVNMSLYSDMYAAMDSLTCPVEGYQDCAVFQRALKGRIISVLFLLDIAQLHQAKLSFMVADDVVYGYRLEFPAARSEQKREVG